MTTPKLKLHSLSDERPVPYQNQHLQTFAQGKDGSIFSLGIKSAASGFIQVPAHADSDRFYVSTEDIAAFLITHNLIELPEKPNPVREAYREAKGAWLSSTMFNKHSEHAYYAIKKLFISHELLKAGYTLSDTLYDQYC